MPEKYVKELNGDQYLKVASYDPGFIRLIMQHHGEKFDHYQKIEVHSGWVSKHPSPYSGSGPNM